MPCFTLSLSYYNNKRWRTETIINYSDSLFAVSYKLSVSDWIIGYSTIPHPNLTVSVYYSVPGIRTISYVFWKNSQTDFMEFLWYYLMTFNFVTTLSLQEPLPLPGRRLYWQIFQDLCREALLSSQPRTAGITSVKTMSGFTTHRFSSPSWCHGTPVMDLPVPGRQMLTFPATI